MQQLCQMRVHMTLLEGHRVRPNPCRIGAPPRWSSHGNAFVNRESLCQTSKKDVAVTSSSGGDSVAGATKALLRELVAGTLTTTSPKSKGGAVTSIALPEDLRSPTYCIAAANLATFMLCVLLPMLPAASLLLNHRQPQFWQLLTSCFAHPSLDSLLQCVFFTYVFGRVVERNHGVIATWAVYLACGTAAAALSWWLLPAKAGLLSSAAPAAAWGLFLVGVGLPRLRSKPLEVACLAPFACLATLARYQPLSSSLLVEGSPVGQLAHLAGSTLAAAGAALVLGWVEAAREAKERERREAQRKAEAANAEAAVNQIVDIAGQTVAKLGKMLS
ncbi:hypothetical protein Agub_g9724 [Astrephomene gubernaculifera]|uniref:Peptidase S54 rhomboid domain-containing protein n=1 Tax=Astrephomene gubernaculifera TaxID=47775 RepID=A0AAD3DWE6_9CHLO|nr:hypothetical protein Agub_g9724 [Astrephomene gubernaculifera]